MRGDRGVFLCVAHGTTRFKNIDLIELQAVQHDLKVAIECGALRAMLQMDSSAVIAYLKGGAVP